MHWKRSAVVWVTVFGLIAASIYFGYSAYLLKIEFPDLHDPSPNVDGYWPAVARFFDQVLCGVTGVLALTVIVTWRTYLSTRKTSKGIPPKQL